jgi:hypothetical protein
MNYANELAILSYAGMYTPSLMTWACLISNRVFVPVPNPIFGTWLQTHVDYGGCNEQSLRSWLSPLDDLMAWPDWDRTILDDRSFFQRYERTKSWKRLNLGREAAYAETLRLIHVASEREVALFMPDDEAGALGEFMFVGKRTILAECTETMRHILLPQLDGITLAAIERLRKSDFRRHFVEYLNELANLPETRAEKIRLRVFESFFAVLGRVKPSIRTASLTGVLVNLPSPIVVNPFGIADSIANINKNIRLKRTHGWLFFLQELHAELSSHSGKLP